MTEYKKMIPLSVIDAKIKEIESDNCYQGPSWDGVRNHFINKIEEIKKEATFVQEPLEQKIKASIKRVEESETDYRYYEVVKVLEKLLK